MRCISWKTVYESKIIKTLWGKWKTQENGKEKSYDRKLKIIEIKNKYPSQVVKANEMQGGLVRLKEIGGV